jgi:hypothetical protein
MPKASKHSASEHATVEEYEGHFEHFEDGWTGSFETFTRDADLATTARDDRVLLETRALGVFIVPFLLVAFPLLYLFPNDTGNWWAWEIRPSMTALIMGAGYIAGAYFFIRVARATRWHRVHLGFLPIAAFTTFLGVATFIYWDRFDHDHVAFWIWTGLYVTTPFLVPLAWLRNRHTDPGTLDSAEDRYLPQGVRSVLKAVGLLQFAIAAVLLASPSTMVDIWPWTLTPLAAATLGAWFALPGVTALMMGIDGRWSAIRITLESQLIGLALILLATARAWEQFDTSNVLTYVFAGGIALLLVGLAALWSSMVLRRPPAPVGSGDPAVQGPRSRHAPADSTGSGPPLGASTHR